MFPYRLSNHAWRRLPAAALAPKSSNSGGWMMRTVVDAGQWRAGFNESTTHPISYLVKCLFIVEPMSNSRLVGYNK
jgi:hypothetical protein